MKIDNNLNKVLGSFKIKEKIEKYFSKKELYSEKNFSTMTISDSIFISIVVLVGLSIPFTIDGILLFFISESNLFFSILKSIIVTASLVFSIFLIMIFITNLLDALGNKKTFLPFHLYKKNKFVKELNNELGTAENFLSIYNSLKKAGIELSDENFYKMNSESEVNIVQRKEDREKRDSELDKKINILEKKLDKLKEEKENRLGSREKSKIKRIIREFNSKSIPVPDFVKVNA